MVVTVMSMSMDQALVGALRELFGERSSVDSYFPIESLDAVRLLIYLEDSINLDVEKLSPSTADFVSIESLCDLVRRG